MNDTLTVNGRERWSATRIRTSPRAESTSATSSDEKKPHDAVNGSSGDVSGRAVASGMTIGDAAVVASGRLCAGGRSRYDVVVYSCTWVWNIGGNERNAPRALEWLAWQ